MVAGQPLHYYYYFNPPTAYYPPYFPHQFDPYYFKNSTMEVTDDMMMPSSPNSTQSDSDNSISSIEVSPKPIQMKKMLKSEEKSEVQCCWRSCGLYFSTLDQLATHVSKVHAAGGPGGLYYCGWEGCPRNNKGFNARYKMLVHVRTHTNEKPHQCYQCKKSFSRAENLKIHSRSHSGEKPYVCPVPGCNKAYSNSSDRFKHTRTHQVEKPYPCKVPGCPKRYTDPSSLRKHVKTYKHFPTEMNASVTVERKMESESKLNVDMENCKINAEPIKEQCTDTSCKHVCPAEKSTDILRLGAIINFRKEEPTIGWNRFLDPFLNEQKTIYPYDLSKSSNMEMDVPLDLSIHRKSI